MVELYIHTEYTIRDGQGNIYMPARAKELIEAKEAVPVGNDMRQLKEMGYSIERFAALHLRLK